MFHEYRDDISKLKQSNAHFTKIFNEHNDLDNKIEHIESGKEHIEQTELEVLKKKKLILKDEVYKMIMDSRK
jgi:uncharacterized protein YdcH (DUF465 family)